MESQSIKANENLKAIEEHENRWKTRLKDAEKKAAQKALEYAKQQEEYLEQMDAVGGNTDITTKISTIKARSHLHQTHIKPSADSLLNLLSLMRSAMSLCQVCMHSGKTDASGSVSDLPDLPDLPECLLNLGKLLGLM